MRQLLRSPLSEQLGPKIALLPEVQAAVTSGTATLHEHYALALVNCCSPEDVLKIYQAATTPLRHPQEQPGASPTLTDFPGLSGVLGVTPGLELIQAQPATHGQILTEKTRAQTRGFFNYVAS